MAERKQVVLKRWSEAEKALLRAEYLTANPKKLARILGRSVKSVFDQAAWLGLPCRRGERKARA